MKEVKNRRDKIEDDRIAATLASIRAKEGRAICLRAAKKGKLFQM